MTLSDLRAKSLAELHKLLEESRRKAYQQRMSLRAQQSHSTHEYHAVRKAIAQILTVLNEKRHAQTA
jgi:ribosomal protein L29